MRITWSRGARRDLRSQRQFIAQTQPQVAASIAQRIISSTDRLAVYPRYGRAATWDPTGQLRELPVAGTPFLVLYTTDATTETILIVRVVHGAQPAYLDR